MDRDIELNHLKYFYFTVLEGGVVQAANRLHVQQPVVSKMLQNLESNLGHQLFLKKGRNKSLTDYGQLVFRHCQVLFDEVDRIRQVSKNPKDLQGSFSLGGSEPIVNFLYGTIFNELIQKYPNLNFNIYTDTQVHLLNMISEGSLELGCFFYAPTLSKDLEILKSLPFRFHLVIKEGLQNQSGVIERFIGSREIDDVSSHRFPTIELMRKEHPKTRIVFSSNSLTLHKQMVLKGNGVSILPRFMVEKELKKGHLVDLYPDKELFWDLMIVKRKTSHLSIPAQEFLSHCRLHYKNLNLEK